MRADKGNAAGVEAVKAKALGYALEMRAVVEHLQGQDKTGLEALMEALNGGGYRTPRGGSWHKTSVRNHLDRLAA